MTHGARRKRQPDRTGERGGLPGSVDLMVVLAFLALAVAIVFMFGFIAETNAQRIAAAAPLTTAACALVSTALAVTKARKPDTELPKAIGRIVPERRGRVEACLGLACVLLIFTPLCGWWYVKNHPIDVTGRASLGYAAKGCSLIPGADPSRIAVSSATDGPETAPNSPCSIYLKLSASGMRRFGGNIMFTIKTPAVDASAGEDCASVTTLSFPTSKGITGDLNQVSSGQAASAQVAGGASEVDVRVTVSTTNNTNCPVYLDLQNVTLTGSWWW